MLFLCFDNLIQAVYFLHFLCCSFTTSPVAINSLNCKQLVLIGKTVRFSSPREGRISGKSCGNLVLGVAPPQHPSHGSLVSAL